MFESAISQLLFYLFAALAVLFAVGVIASRNPVSSAMNMALCFAMTAAVLFGLGAQFMGIVQIIVYAGAILVLFLFVVMMLDIKAEEKEGTCWPRAFAGTVIAGLFAGLIANVSINLPGGNTGSCPVRNLAASLFCDEAAPCPTAQEMQGIGGSLPALNVQKAALAANPGMTEEQAAQVTVYPDTKLLGSCLFSRYSLHFAILSFALLAGAVGSIALARKIRKD